MESHTLFSDTICAPCTPTGGAIAIIRIAGPQAISIAEKVFRPASGKAVGTLGSHTLAFGNVHDSRGGIVDEAVASIFRAPHSYTGEDIVELSCHGSSYIVKRVMETCLEQGCRAAEAGEFTKRAYLNGKMDLCQAEAVADLIASSSAAAHRMAMHQLRGGVSNELGLLREKLLPLTALMELELDFSDHEDLEFANREELATLTRNILSKVTALAQTFRLGNALKEGIPVAIVGETNVGKSTLLNLLAHDGRAIVSNIHGTTRDVIEDTIHIKGIPVRLTDTAGIRESTDIVENMGIQKTYEKLRQAEVILWVVDLAHIADIEAMAEKLATEGGDKRTIILLNKSDLLAEGGEVSTPVTDDELRRKVAAALPPRILASKHPKLVLSAAALQTDPTSESTTNGEGTTNGESTMNGESMMNGESTKNGESTMNGGSTKNGEGTMNVATPRRNEDGEEALVIVHDLSELEDHIAQAVEEYRTPAATTIITNARHYRALCAARESLTRVADGIRLALPTEFISQDLRETISHLGEITGQSITTEDVLTSVFSHFCIGK